MISILLIFLMIMIIYNNIYKYYDKSTDINKIKRKNQGNDIDVNKNHDKKIDNIYNNHKIYNNSYCIHNNININNNNTNDTNMKNQK